MDGGCSRDECAAVSVLVFELARPQQDEERCERNEQEEEDEFISGVAARLVSEIAQQFPSDGGHL